MKEPDFSFRIRNPRLGVIRKRNMRWNVSSWDGDFRVTCSQCAGVLEPSRVDKGIMCLMLLMYLFMRVLRLAPRTRRFGWGDFEVRRVWYPVALEAVLVAKVDVVDVEREAFWTLQGARGIFTTGTFANGGLFCRRFWLGFSYGGDHRLATLLFGCPTVCSTD